MYSLGINLGIQCVAIAYKNGASDKQHKLRHHTVSRTFWHRLPPGSYLGGNLNSMPCGSGAEWSVCSGKRGAFNSTSST